MIASTVVAAWLSVAALHPPEGDKPLKSAASSCNHIRMLVQMFGEAAVIAEARRRGISDAVIFQAKRRCLGEK